MKIQIWSDFVCPFCYVGKRHLEEAIKDLDEDIEIEMMSFELDQNYVNQPDLSIHEVLAKKYNIPVHEAQFNNNRVGDMAKKVGLDYNFDAMKYTNTFNAHCAFQYAKLKGKGNEFSEALLHGYFTQGLDLSRKDDVVAIGVSVGLDEEGLRNAYNSDQYGLSVRQDEQWASMIGARGVPHFVINDKVSLSGAQPIDVFKEAIAYAKDIATKEQVGSDAGMCEDGECRID